MSVLLSATALPFETGSTNSGLNYFIIAYDLELVKLLLVFRDLDPPPIFLIFLYFKSKNDYLIIIKKVRYNVIKYNIINASF